MIIFITHSLYYTSVITEIEDMSYRQIFSTIGLVTVTVSYLIYRTIQRRRRGKHLPPDPKWVLVGKIEEISMYPLQSGAALIIPTVKCNKYGLVLSGLRDRCLVLLNEFGEVAFSGTYPNMLSIRTEIESESCVTIRAPNMESLSLNLAEIAQGVPVIEKQRKGFKMFLIECQSAHHRWFSNVILHRDKGMKLFISLEPKLELNMWDEEDSVSTLMVILSNRSNLK